MKEIFASNVLRAELTAIARPGYSKPEGIIMPDIKSVEKAPNSGNSFKKELALEAGRRAGEAIIKNRDQIRGIIGDSVAGPFIEEAKVKTLDFLGDARDSEALKDVRGKLSEQGRGVFEKAKGRLGKEKSTTDEVARSESHIDIKSDEPVGVVSEDGADRVEKGKPSEEKDYIGDLPDFDTDLALAFTEIIEGAIVFGDADEDFYNDQLERINDFLSKSEELPDQEVNNLSELSKYVKARRDSLASGGGGEPTTTTPAPEPTTTTTPEPATPTPSPEPEAGGGGDGDEPPDDKSATPEPEGGDDSDSAREGGSEDEGEFRDKSKEIIDPEMFSNPEHKRLAQHINEVASRGMLTTEDLNDTERDVLKSLKGGKLEVSQKEEAYNFIKKIRERKTLFSQQKKREEAEQRLISESAPDFELLRREGPLYSKYGRALENLWNEFREEMESGTFNRQNAEARIEKIWNELNRESVGLPEIKEEDREALSDGEGAHRESLTAEFYVAQNLLSHEISKIYKKYVIGEVRRGTEDPHAESIRNLWSRHRQLDKLFEEMRSAGFSEDAIIGDLSSVLGTEDVVGLNEYKDEFKIAEKDNTYEIVKNYLYTKMEHEIDRIGFDTSGVYRSEIINEIAEMSLSPEAKDRGYEYYGMALEYAVERIIGMGDDNPLSEYPQFNLQQTQNLDDLIQSARTLDENFYKYLVNLKGKRQIAHSLFKNLKDAKAFMELVTRALDTGGFKFIEDEVGGISWMQNAYEQELGWRTAFNGFTEKGWLLFTDYRVADDNVKKQAQRAGASGFLRKSIVPYGKVKGFGDGVSPEEGTVNSVRKMRPWEVDRAVAMGKAMNAATQRRLVYTVMGDVNENVPIQDSIRSLESEFITNRLSPIKLVARRYFGGMSGAKRLFRHAQDRIMQRGIEGPTRKIYGFSRNTEGDDQTYAPYGYDTTSNVVLESGIVDPKSSHWRAKPLFLDLKEYRRYNAPHGLSFEPYVDEHITLIKYIDLLKQDSGANEHGHGREGWEEEFNTRIRPVLENERLNLGILLSHVGGFNQENKELLWNKASEFLPSRVASILPHDTVRIIQETYRVSEKEALEKWDGIRTKLYMAEQNRVTEDSEMLRVRADEDGRVTDVPIWAGKNLDEYFEQVNLGVRFVEGEDGEVVREVDEQELEVVRRLQGLGRARASQLAQMHFPFTTFLDDVPKTGWENLGRTDLDRILVLDQTDMQEGYGQIVSLIANPAQGLKEVKEMFHTAVEKIKSPTSLDAAQRYVEPWIFSYLVMAARRPKDIATFGARRLFRGATSEMQEFNKSTEVSYDPEVIADFLKELAVDEIIADDPAEAEHDTKFAGLTQYERLRKELKVRTRDLTKWQLYYLILILFTASGFKMLKEGLPDD